MGDEYLAAEAAYWRSTLGSISVKRGGIQFPHFTETNPMTGKTRIHEDERVDMQSNEEILAQAQAKRDEAAELERRVAEREKYGADLFKNGTILKVEMKYRGSNRSYAYAVIKVGGRYYLSGKMGSTAHDQAGYTWDNFVAWLAQGDATVWRARNLEQVL